MQEYNDDSALLGDGNDLFGRRDYAAKLADILTSLGNESSFVVGIYSKWGYGKTSTINFVKHQLNTKNNVEIIDLEPWNYATSKELAANLLYELSDKLGLDSVPVKKAGRIFRKAQTKTADVLSKAASSTSIKANDNVNLSVGNVAGAVLALTSILSSPREYGFQKNKIEEVIKASKKQLIVFIDDIDRLDADKILGVFKLIKSVANIKGVTYVVSFDEQVVSEAISEMLPKKQGGKDYIDKIVQIPVVLPLIERFDLDRYMDEKIEQVLRQNEVSILDEEKSDLQVLYRTIKHRLDTPRAINRFTNALMFSVPLLKNEVSVSDLVSIELLRITYPDLYEAIRNNREILTKERHYDGFERDSQAEESIKAFNVAFQSNEDWLEILSCLFPHVNKYYFKKSTYDDASFNRKHKRLKSFEYFHRYFTYSVGNSDTSDVFFAEQLQKNDGDVNKFIKLLGNDSWRGLQKIEDNLDLVGDVPQFSGTLVSATELLDREARGFFSTVPVESAIFIVNKLLKQRPEVSPLDTYLSILNSCKTTEALSYLMRRVNVSYKNEDADERFLTEKEFEIFKRESVNVIKRLIDKKTMPIDDYATTSSELYEFMCLFEGTPETVNEYIRSRIKTGKQAVDFVSQFLGKWSNLGSNRHFRSDLLDSGSATYKYWFENKLDSKHIYERIITSKDYKKYKDTSWSEIKEFKRHENDPVALTGNEKSDDFRNVIAQQFVYLYESNAK